MTAAKYPTPACQTLSDLSAQMLQAAREGRWDDLGALEPHYSRQARALTQGEGPLSDGDRARLAGVLRAVLANEKEVRDKIAARMTDLSALAANAGARRKLARAYGAG